ncbi:unnamed protein product [Cunninghamella blakesleeana]
MNGLRIKRYFTSCKYRAVNIYLDSGVITSSPYENDGQNCAELSLILMIKMIIKMVPCFFFNSGKMVDWDSDSKRRRDSINNRPADLVQADSPGPSSILPSSPAPFFSEADFRNDIEELRQ